METIDLLLHPVRLRIILAVANRTLTTQQLAGMLSDVAQTTLYRQINLLLEGGILKVVRETRVRGTVERELALVEGAARIDMETSTSLSSEQQEQLFSMFVATLVADYKKALSQAPKGMPPAVYQRQRLSMTFEEMLAINQQLDALLSRYKEQSLHSDRANVQTWLFTGIVMPDADIPQSSDEETVE